MRDVGLKANVRSARGVLRFDVGAEGGGAVRRDVRGGEGRAEDDGAQTLGVAAHGL